MRSLPNGVLIIFHWLAVNGLPNQMSGKGCFVSESLFHEPHCFVPFCYLYLEVLMFC